MVFVFDVDGTLLDDKEDLSEENKKAVLRAAERSLVILASGRMLKSVLKFSKENFDRVFPTIAYNGGMVYIPEKGVVYENKIPPDVASDVIRHLRRLNVHRQIYVNDELISEEDNEEIKAYAKHSGVDYKVVDDLIDVVSKNGSTKILAISDPETLEEVKETLSPLFASLKIFKSFPTYLDFVPESVGKAKALKFLASYMGFSLDDVVAFGDNDNDAEVVEVAKIGIAMGNATQKVKEVADFVAPSNNESGVAKVVNLILDGSFNIFDGMESN